jgi:hypothetical protein
MGKFQNFSAHHPRLRGPLLGGAWNQRLDDAGAAGLRWAPLPTLHITRQNGHYAHSSRITPCNQWLTRVPKDYALTSPVFPRTHMTLDHYILWLQPSEPTGDPRPGQERA